ncbi:hypothetical protein GCM10009828_036780 [Actinoplanes couchii]|uniref:DUF1273 domain-containing protein n=1 Tax=Actinoplanes couchii TaxID=403638 RepID=A0ABQ3X9H2_9ACTN|nr:hypothetical protein Aco03nite_035460 [Actinoplanes couchii]
MTTIGVTGHIRMQPRTHRLIFDELVRLLSGYPGVHGVTCLAEGADQLFAEAVRACHGTFEVVLPVPAAAVPPAAPPARLLRQARRVSWMEVAGPPEAAYEAASREVVSRSDILVAVWDGDLSGGRGGTAETVDWACRHGREVVRVWPAGARRITVPVG